VNALTLLCDEDHERRAAGGDGRPRVAFARGDKGSQRMSWGRREGVWPLGWHGRGITPGLVDLCEFTLARLAFKRTVARVVAPPLVAHLERGDVAVVECPALTPLSLPGEIIAFRGGAMKRFEIEVSATPALGTVWEEDAQTRLLLRAGRGRLYAFVGGARVASLDRAGTLRLAGEVIENGWEASEMSAPVEYDADASRVVFGVGYDGSYQSAFALDGDGNLLVRGELVEGADLSGEPIGTDAFVEATAASLNMSVDGVEVVLSYDAASERLRLRDEVIEHARWI
jgi:hypothetical protein